jgi:hypothetical protein
MNISRLARGAFVMLLSAPYLCAELDTEALSRKMEALSIRVADSVREAINEEEYRQNDTSIDAFLSRNDPSRAIIRMIVSKIESSEEIQQAKELANNYSEGNAQQKLAAQVLNDALKKKALFLGIQGSNEERAGFLDGISADVFQPVETDIFLRPEEFAVLEVPSAVGSVFVTDRKWQDRSAHFTSILERHDCDILSGYTWAKGDDSHNYFVSCKKFVLDELINHFGGVQGQNFELQAELKVGGWLLNDKVEITIPIESKSKEKTSFQWFDAMIRPELFQYINKNQPSLLAKLGKTAEVAGDTVRVLKNARAKIWLKPAGEDVSHSVYYTEEEYGDIQLKEGGR